MGKSTYECVSIWAWTFALSATCTPHNLLLAYRLSRLFWLNASPILKYGWQWDQCIEPSLALKCHLHAHSSMYRERSLLPRVSPLPDINHEKGHAGLPKSTLYMFVGWLTTGWIVGGVVSMVTRLQGKVTFIYCTIINEAQTLASVSSREGPQSGPSKERRLNGKQCRSVEPAPILHRVDSLIYGARTIGFFSNTQYPITWYSVQRSCDLFSCGTAACKLDAILSCIVKNEVIRCDWLTEETGFEW